LNCYAELAENLSAGNPELVLLERMKGIKPPPAEEEKDVITTCTVDCGGTCPLQVHLKNGIIKKITFYDDGEAPPLQGCIRGLNFHYRVYAPDRIKYPLIRVGERGEGRFKRISWEKAISIIAGEMKRIKESYGPEAILECNYSGSTGVVLHATIWGANYHLLSCFGGRTAFGTLTSNVGASWASRFTYGDIPYEDANSFSDIVNAKLIILWGLNPAENRFGTETFYWLTQAKKKGIKIICIDPCCTDSVRALGAEWIPVKPSTDTAMLIAMAFVLLTEDIYDKDYAAKYVFGLDSYRDYVLGVADGIPKSPEWAAKITGVPADIITRLAREYASAKPAALIQGWAPGRTANGEQYHRAALALQAMTGNIGIRGGSGSCGGLQYRGGKAKTSLAKLISTLRLKHSSRLNYGGKGVEIKPAKWADAVLHGKAGGYPSDIKMIYVVGHNILNQRQNVKKGIEAFKKVEFAVCQELFLTPTARYSDIVLPVTTNFERNDISIPWVKGCYAVYANKVIDPLWDCKSDLDIARALARKLGVDGFEDKTDDELLRERFNESQLKDHLSYDEFKKKGLLRLDKEPFIAFKERIEDPEANPFPTPSGKIEIYSLGLDGMDFNVRDFSSVKSDFRDIPRIPTFLPCDEIPASLKTGKYPLQLTTPHSRYRVHSQYFNIPRLRNLYRHEIWMNPDDAADRGIKDGDSVRVFNDRGTIAVLAKVTDRMMPGVVRCYEGAWYDPDEEGVDRGGCVNVLIDDMLTSPAGASNFNTCMVDVAREEKIN